MQLIDKYIARQLRKPTGFFGKLAARTMNKQNKKLYDAVIENIDIRETDTVLEIGFGNGYLIRTLSEKCPQKLYGIDISADMLKTASRKNRKKIEEGKIILKLADVQDLPFNDASIDKIYTINTVYFWQDYKKCFSEIRRILKPDGIFINVHYLKEAMDDFPVTQYGFTKFTAEQMKQTTTESGLKIEQIVKIEQRNAICVIARNV
jgi:ubiquinone/menaquinone biosynthesis C-methylase UbiE